MLQKIMLTLGIGAFLLFGVWGLVSPAIQADELNGSTEFLPTPTPTASPTASPSPTGSPTPEMPAPSPTPSVTPKP